MATQTVELTFQTWEYSVTKTTTVGGNCTGLSVIEAAIGNIEDELGGDDGELILTNAAGEELASELWENKLEDMLVCARIVAIEPTLEDEPPSLEDQVLRAIQACPESAQARPLPHGGYEIADGDKQLGTGTTAVEAWLNAAATLKEENATMQAIRPGAISDNTENDL